MQGAGGRIPDTWEYRPITVRKSSLGLYYRRPALPRVQAGDIDAAPCVWNSICCHNARGVTGAFIGSIGSTGPYPDQARSRQTGGAGTGWAGRDGTGDPTAGCHSPWFARCGVPQRHVL
jgi:hypothetical protein